MIFSADEILKTDRLTGFSSTPSYGLRGREQRSSKIHDLVTPTMLIAYGVMANALFWSGLLTPFNANAGPEIPYLHAFVMLLGVAMAFGAAMATLAIVYRKMSVSLRSLEFVAAFLNIFVLTASGALAISALLRGV